MQNGIALSLSLSQRISRLPSNVRDETFDTSVTEQP